jgi:uncharacterized membrane protein
VITTADSLLFLLRWLHLLGGVAWVGMLYYFNFVQTPFFATADPAVRSGMIAGGLVGRALWWFRWAAMLTFVTGWLYLLHRMFRGFGGVAPFFSEAYGWAIFIGAVLGTLMWLNVWLVIWPAQQVVIASITAVARGGRAVPEAAAHGMRAGLASRTNTVLSIPMLFFMAAASHFPFFTPTTGGAKIAMLVVLAVVVLLVEANALIGTGGAGKKVLGTVKGALWLGFLLTLLLVLALKLVFA